MCRSSPNPNRAALHDPLRVMAGSHGTVTFCGYSIAPDPKAVPNKMLNQLPGGSLQVATDRAEINGEPRYRRRTMKRLFLHHDVNLSSRLHEIIEQRLLHAVFQPVIAMRGGGIVGYEGLIRGPVDSPLHMPVSLFDIAARHGLELAIEHLSRQVVTATFVERNLPGKLFLNISPDVLTQSPAENGNFAGYLKEIGLPPERVIIELTENQPTYDLGKMREAILYYRGLGFEVAIDDLGEGFSSLRLWSELRPEFVKIDKHFVKDVSLEPLKLEFVKAIQQIAACCGSRVIAEGIENRQDFRVLRDVGIGYGQGYLIARPSARPASELETDALQALQSHGIAVYPNVERASNRTVKTRKLLIEVNPVAPDTRNKDVYAVFEGNAELISLPVVKGGVPIGLIQRRDLIADFAKPYRRELYGQKPCMMFMATSPLIVEHDLSIQDLSVLVADGDPRYLADGFIITENGRYLGIGTTRDLIREITQMQISAARYANPLTLLPGNVPISEHMDRLLTAGAPFCACYCDLDNFKPFNDVYGYHKGDEIIQLTARILSSQCDPERDFIGHIGGDDFIVMFQSADWEMRCRTALDQFGAQVPTLLSEDDRARGGITSQDRGGQETFYPFPTLSIGAIAVQSNELTSHLEVSAAAAEAKKQAKRIAGNSLFIERRKPFDGGIPARCEVPRDANISR